MSHDCDPPVEVDVYPAQMWPAKLFLSAPLVVRAQGIATAGPIPGLLHRWVMASHGGWLGLVEMTVFLWDEPITLRCLCPAGCVYRRGQTPWGSGRG